MLKMKIFRLGTTNGDKKLGTIIIFLKKIIGWLEDIYNNGKENSKVQCHHIRSNPLIIWLTLRETCVQVYIRFWNFNIYDLDAAGNLWSLTYILINCQCLSIIGLS
jgi:hypothetical protein